MAAGVTNRGRARELRGFYRNEQIPAQFYLALVVAASAPTLDTNTLGELTQIAVGNGYTNGGLPISRDAAGFPSLAEDDALDLATLGLKNVIWTATGGPLPASGSGARYAVLTDDNAVAADREVLMWWDFGVDASVSQNQQLSIADCYRQQQT